MSWRRFRSLATDTYQWWSSHNAPRLGAALAYYALLSIAPLMILVVAICGLIFRHSAEQQVLQQTREYIGGGGADTLHMLLDNAHQPKTGLFATVVALLTLLFGASGVFTELRASLNSIWDVSPDTHTGIRQMIFQRLGSFLMVIALGVLLLLSLLVSAGLAVVQSFAATHVPVPAAVLAETVNTISSLAVLTLFFGLIYKYVPDASIEWRDVGVGAGVTSLLFMLGKILLAVYFRTTAVGSTYGAAGSIVAFVVWVYYSAQIFFFGAVFTRIYARKLGSQQTRTPAPRARAGASWN